MAHPVVITVSTRHTFMELPVDTDEPLPLLNVARAIVRQAQRGEVVRVTTALVLPPAELVAEHTGDVERWSA